MMAAMGMFTGLFAAVSCLALPPVRWLLFKTGLLPNTHVFINECVCACAHTHIHTQTLCLPPPPLSLTHTHTRARAHTHTHTYTHTQTHTHTGLLPKPGEGPSKTLQETGYFHSYIVAEGEGGVRGAVTTAHIDQHH